MGECLAQEATDELSRLAPVGAAVTLDYDTDRRDRYGRLLAAVTNADGTSVSVALAEQGLGSAVSYGGNTKFLADVSAGQEAASNAQLGLSTKPWNALPPP
ncbi:thermonuclease family protein [Agromyces archimandritae]|uniref:Thermonuclease family protein n=1 Tax=Agromyces archimandritae TaxID=2781962 RepID=A0A975FPC7_9MICO|nr:thermonuclease family protein [Agromyces archimandritae]QTX05651.1 thermonuclease family protein [Agromyces archimandritae]